LEGTPVLTSSLVACSLFALTPGASLAAIPLAAPFGSSSATLARTVDRIEGGVPNLRSLAGKGAVLVGGHSSAGDGGGGTFEWMPASTAPDNGGTIVAPNPAQPGRWVRVHSGTLNARWFGAGLSLGNDSTRIANALAALAAAGGGELFFPTGNYATTSTITLGSGMILRGESMASRIIAVGSFDTVTIAGTPGAQLANIGLDTLYFAEHGKLGGNSILAQHVSQLGIRNCQFDSPSTGIRLHGFNTVDVQKVRIAGVRATNAYGFWLTGDAVAGSDVISFKDVVVQGGVSSSHSQHGVIVDGRVNTLSAYKLYCVNSDGAGVWFRNTMGSSDPQFATFYGLEVDFPYFEAVHIAAGRQIYFTDAQMHGSATRANVYIAPEASVIGFTGGFSHGAAAAGFDVYGRQVSITGVDVYANSLAAVGTYSGIELNPTSRMVTVTGNKCGDPATPTQLAGIRIGAGADQFTVVGNTAFHNGVGVSNSAGTGSSRVVANNAQ